MVEAGSTSFSSNREVCTISGTDGKGGAPGLYVKGKLSILGVASGVKGNRGLKLNVEGNGLSNPMLRSSKMEQDPKSSAGGNE